MGHLRKLTSFLAPHYKFLQLHAPTDLPLDRKLPVSIFYMKLYVPTASMEVLAMPQSLFLLLCCSGLCVTDCIEWRVYPRSTRVSDNIATGCNKQNFICHRFFVGPHLQKDNIAFHFSHFGLSLHPQCCIDSLLFFPVTIWQSVCVTIMSRPSKKPRLLQQNMWTDCWQWQSDSIKQHQFRWGRSWRCARGVKTSTIPPNSQLSRVQQFNFVQCLWRSESWWEWARWTNSIASNPAMDMPLLPSEQCSTHIYRRPQRKGQWSVTHKRWLKST